MSIPSTAYKLTAMVAAAGLALTSCNAPNATADNAQSNSQGQEVAPPKSAVVFDVPALIGKTIDEVEQAVGPADAATQPTDEEQRLVGFEWKKTFTKGDYQLIAKYYSDSKKVYAFTITMKKGAQEKRGGRSKGLDEIANVNPGASQYYIMMEPVPGSKAPIVDSDAPPVLPKYMGITIIPAPDSTDTAATKK